MVSISVLNKKLEPDRDGIRKGDVGSIWGLGLLRWGDDGAKEIEWERKNKMLKGWYPNEWQNEMFGCT